jgi:hypothetical protein
MNKPSKPKPLPKAPTPPSARIIKDGSPKKKEKKDSCNS